MKASYALSRPVCLRCSVSKRWFVSRHLSSASKASTQLLRTLPDTPCRTRFAPSPTGYLHLGSLRTALFNYLLARATRGQFLLRLEDTDQSRTVPDAEQRIYEDLGWTGLTWDEGPNNGGPHGPYKQSLRKDIYSRQVQQLVDSGKAYRCFCSPEELDALQRGAHAQGLPSHYPGTCLTISPEESADRAHRGDPHVVRFKGSTKPAEFQDLVYGRFTKADPERDFIILKRDGLPTYHLANVVDDHLMQITHVVRGAEWLISTPRHIELYDAFGWKPPRFAHVGLLVDQQRQKLSKRHPGVSLSWYRDHHILPPALLNFAVLLGWNPGLSRTVMTLDEMVDNFFLKFTKGDIIVGLERLQYFQKAHASRLVQGDAADTQLIRASLVQAMVKLVLDLETARAEEDKERTDAENTTQSSLDGVDGLVPALSPREPALLEDFLFRLLQIGKAPAAELTEYVHGNRFVIWQPQESQVRIALTKLLEGVKTVSLQGKVAKPADVADYVLEQFEALADEEWTASTIEKRVHDVAGAVSWSIEGAAPTNVTSAGYKFLRWMLLASAPGPSLHGLMALFGRTETLRRLTLARAVASSPPIATEGQRVLAAEREAV